MAALTVSIVIPFKNTSAYLEACLDSVLRQSYAHWEVLAVDDHSTDNCLALVESYVQRDPRIKVFQNAGVGIIPALRTAYAQSSGDLITRMDSDDVMTEERLRLMVTSLEEHGKGHLAVGQVRYFSFRGISNGYARYERWLNKLTAKGTNFSEIYKECVVPSPCWMAYREDFIKCRGFDSDRYPEDYDLTFRFYEQDLKIIPCVTVLHLWRDYDTRTSRTHEHYAQNYFLDIKLHYFLKLEYQAERPLVIWGAGFKGKTIAKSLVEKKINFTWLCDNPKKINKKIYGIALVHYQMLEQLEHPQSIVTVANGAAQQEIRSYLKKLGQHPMQDYYFFC